MPKFAANLSMLFTEVEFLDRFEAAARAGFKGVEYLFPYDYPAEELKRRLDANGLTQVLFNLPAGDWAAGERGIACHPDRVEEFREGVERAIAYARVLGNTQVNCLAGIKPEGVGDDQARATLVENLRFAAEKLAAAGILLIAEHRQPLGQSPHRQRRDLHPGPHLRARGHRADPDRAHLRAGLRHRLRRPAGA